MVTKSIVGRFLILAVLLVSLGVIAQAALIITKSSGKMSSRTGTGSGAAVASLTPSSANAATRDAASAQPPAAGQTTDATPVRVVYPGPLGDAPIQPRKIADAAPVSPIVTATPAQAALPVQAVPAAQPVAPVAAAKPVTAPVVVASAEPAETPATEAGEASPAGKGGVNLNHASIDALNRLGGGHIGQTIVQHRPYHSVEDLVKKRVVRRSVYDQIKNQVAAE